MKRRYPSVYVVTREFGGHEEGGWWFNRFELVDGYGVRKKKRIIKKYVKKLYKEWAHQSWGDIYSMRGGEKYEIVVDSYPYELETRSRPQYD